jgi:hypothetical protein
MAEPVVPAGREEPPRSPWWFLSFTFAIAAAVLVFLRVVVGVAIDAPTLGLAVACAALIGALRGMWGVVFALTRPRVETIVSESEVGLGLGSKAELREEKQRVLRAIKELEFDHAMGKLSDHDFKQVGDGYRLRAIEVIRALDEDQGELHPLLREHLESLGQALRGEAPVAAPTPEPKQASEAAP